MGEHSELIESYEALLTEETMARYFTWVLSYENDEDFTDFINDRYPKLLNLGEEERLEVFKVITLEMLSSVYGTILDK